MIRALRFQSKLPKTFWGDCLLTSTYLINKLPNFVLGFISPYEKLIKQQPSYQPLRAFGCLAYMSQNLPDKLEARAVQTIFIGYSPTQRGYKLYDPVNHTFHVSRHVIFDESTFSYETAVSSEVPFPMHGSLFGLDSPFDDELEFVFTFPQSTATHDHSFTPCQSDNPA